MDEVTADDDRQAYLDRVRMALAMLMVDDAEPAIEDVEALARDHPDRAEAHFLTGLVASRLDDYGLALERFVRAHELDSQCREYADALAVLYTRVGRLADGLYFAKLATVLDPHPDVQPMLPMEMTDYFGALVRTHPSPYFIEANILFNRRKFADAANACERELRINNDHGACYGLLGKCYLAIGDFEGARDALAAAHHLQPRDSEHLLHLGRAHYHLQNHEAAVDAHRLALDRAPESVALAAEVHRMSAFLGDEGDDTRAAFLEALRERAANVVPAHEIVEHSPEAEEIEALETELHVDLDGLASPHHPGEKITVGYICNGLFACDDMYLFEPLLKHHDRNRFDLQVYQQSITEDAANLRIRGYGEFLRRIYDIDDKVMDIIIAGDEVDVLVDMTGGSLGNRAALVASRPAKVQIAWGLEADGLGMLGIDFVLSDPVTRSTDERALGSDQQIIELPYGLVGLEGFEIMLDVVDPPMAEAGFVTMGGIADPAYLSAETVTAWCAVLEALPDSRLLLGGVPFVSRLGGSLILDRFAERGLRDRVDFWHPTTPERIDYSFLNHIDLYLDTTPVSGRLDLARAMWMGVPVLSLRGSHRDGLMGASLLTAAGRTDWIVDDGDAMAARAADLTADADALTTLRHGLREELRKTTLFQAQVFTREFERAIERAYEIKMAAS